MTHVSTADTDPALVGTPAAMTVELFHSALTRGTLKQFWTTHSASVATVCHSVVVESKQQPGHLTAIANMAMLCTAEAQAPGGKANPDKGPCVLTAESLGSFDCLLDSLSEAAQVCVTCSHKTVHVCTGYKHVGAARFSI